VLTVVIVAGVVVFLFGPFRPGCRPGKVDVVGRLGLGDLSSIHQSCDQLGFLETVDLDAGGLGDLSQFVD
jgi:hypothetical protein